MRRRGDLQRSLPRPHDTGMVTLISRISRIRPARSRLPQATRRRYPPVWSGRLRGDPSAVVQQNVSFGQLQSAVGAGLQLRLFGKPEIDGTRRLG